MKFVFLYIVNSLILFLATLLITRYAPETELTQYITVTLYIFILKPILQLNSLDFLLGVPDKEIKEQIRSFVSLTTLMFITSIIFICLIVNSDAVLILIVAIYAYVSNLNDLCAQQELIQCRRSRYLLSNFLMRISYLVAGIVLLILEKFTSSAYFSILSIVELTAALFRLQSLICFNKIALAYQNIDRKIFKFSLFSIPGFFSGLLLNQFDRYSVKYYFDDALLVQYGVSFFLATSILTIASGIINYIRPKVFALIKFNKISKKMLLYFYLVFLTLVLLIVSLSPLIKTSFILIYGDKFSSGATIFIISLITYSSLSFYKIVNIYFEYFQLSYARSLFLLVGSCSVILCFYAMDMTSYSPAYSLLIGNFMSFHVSLIFIFLRINSNAYKQGDKSTIQN